ncbi:MAG: hypothetical protein RL318_2260 [Fibrobacterota bacterium]|jgi:uncharacterized membrane protein
MSSLSRAWIRLAAVYFALACTFGLGVGIAQKFELATVHAHLNLLGWVSMALIGLLHATVPGLIRSTSKASFYAYQVAFPLFLASMLGTLVGNEFAKIAIRGTGLLMLGAVIWVSVQIFRSVGTRD